MADPIATATTTVTINQVAAATKTPVTLEMWALGFPIASFAVGLGIVLIFWGGRGLWQLARGWL